MKNIRTINDNVVKYYLYVGFGISKQDLKLLGEEFVFRSSRERSEFKNIILTNRPRTMEEIKIIYKLYV